MLAIVFFGCYDQLEKERKNMKQCVKCNEMPIHYQERELCKGCYHFLRHRKLLHLYPAKNLFKKRLIKRHGDKIISDIKKAKETTALTYADIGEQYDLSRERIRQICNELFGLSYNPYKKSDTEKIRHFHPISKASRAPKGTKVSMGFDGELIVYNKLKSLGFDVTYPLEKAPYDFMINDYKIEVKTSYKKAKMGKYKYYRAKTSSNELKVVEFIIFYIPIINSFYIYPIGKINKCGVININPDPRSLSNMKNLKYKDRWELLAA